MSAPKIEIKNNGDIFTQVFIDGQEIHGVREIRFIASSCNKKYEIPEVELKLLATDLAIETKVMPKLPYPFSDYYIPKFRHDAETGEIVGG